jgi:OOP family OmpA-OmpF porin
VVIAAGLAASVPALGQSFYIGGGLGQTKADVDNAGFNAAVAGLPGVTGVGTVTDERDTGWKLFAGYQFHPNFAAELTYANLGKYHAVSTVQPGGGTIAGDVKLENNWSADLLGIWPFANNFSIFGRLGVLWSEAKVTLTGVGPGGVAGISTKDDDLSWKVGAGVGYEFTRQFGVRGEWERYRVSDGVGGRADVDLFSVSARFKF